MIPLPAVHRRHEADKYPRASVNFTRNPDAFGFTVDSATGTRAAAFCRALPR
jgi:hypothetical protein